MLPARTLLALALLAPVARGDDGDPVVLETLMNNQPATEAPVGAVVKLRGKHLHRCPPARDGEKPCRHRDVRVSIGGVECMLLSANPEFVSFIIPHKGVPPGRVSIRLAIADRQPVESPFKVLSFDEWGCLRRKQDVDVCLGSHPEPEETWTCIDGMDALPGHRFEITRFDLVGQPGAWRFEVAGRATHIPDGFQVTISLERLGRDPARVGTHTVPIECGRMLAAFGPFALPSTALHAAWLEFRVGRQGQLKARRWLATLTESEKEVYEELRVRALWPLPHGAEPGVGGLFRIARFERVRGVNDRLEAEVMAWPDCPPGAQAALTLSRDGEPIESRRVAIRGVARSSFPWPGRLPPGEYELALRVERVAQPSEVAHVLGSERVQRGAWLVVR